MGWVESIEAVFQQVILLCGLFCCRKICIVENENQQNTKDTIVRTQKVKAIKDTQRYWQQKGQPFENRMRTKCVNDPQAQKRKQECDHDIAIGGKNRILRE